MCTESTVSSYSELTKRHTISYTSKPKPEMHIPPEMVELIEDDGENLLILILSALKI
jgi:hypothetical protein